MNNLTEAYHSIYQLDEVRFTSGLVQSTNSSALNTAGLQLPDKKPSEKPPTAPVLPPPAATPTPAATKPSVPMGKTAAGTSYEIRTPTSAELKAAQNARATALASGASRADAEEAAVKAGVAAGKPSVSQPAPAAAPTSQATQDATKSLEQDKKTKPFDTSKMTTTRRETFNYGGEMEQEQLQALLAAYEEMYKVPEESESPKEELQEKAQDDPCWKGYTQVGMKKKGGREVPNCVPSKGVPDAKGYKKEEAELEEGAAGLLRLGLAAGTALAGMKVAKDAKKVADTINTQNKAKEAFYKKTLRNSYEPEGEVVEAYDVVLDHLMSEGFASNVESAEKIMMVMSDKKIQEIVNLYL
jgi:hypothetical protein